ncbi:MAG TPA: hypothetical protein VI451_07100 [Anaerolineales bacterium]|nr:hypothetical protein [Anaerolineales bacterium]
MPSITLPSHKWRTLLLLSLAELLGMSVWFSASAVVPALTDAWSLTDAGRAWLTMSVQIGFVVGAFGSAVLNLADLIPARLLFAGTAILAGVVTALIPLTAIGLGIAIFLRFLSGVFLAGVYPVVLANLGYLGHMWELYAMWSWIAIFFQSSFGSTGVTPAWASFATFFVIGVGGLGSAVAGKLADREYVGTALTLQTSLGFLLTLVTIRLIPSVQTWVGWRWAFAFLALGPVVGIWAMETLRRSEAVRRLAGGRG